MSQLDDTLKAIIDSRQYMDGDTSYMTQEELDEAKQQIKDLMLELIGEDDLQVQEGNEVADVIKFGFQSEVRAEIRQKVNDL